MMAMLGTRRQSDLVLFMHYMDQDYPEIVGFQRFINGTGLSTSVGQSANIGVSYFGNAKELEAKFQEFKNLFFVDLKAKADGRVVVDLPYTQISGDLLLPSRFRAIFANRSIVQRALDSYFRKFTFFKRCPIIEFKYRLRPWLSANGKRCEVVDGILKYISDGEKSETGIWYESIP